MAMLRTKKFLFITIAGAVLIGLALGACGQAQPKETPSLRMAVLPILDAMPMYVAAKEGLFEKNGVQVELIPAGSAAERDQIINAGQADGMINETVSTILYNKDQPQVQIVRFARTAQPESPMYRVLATSGSDITNPDQLKGVEIGISEGTVIEYITDRLLETQGLTTEDIKTVAVPKIGDRMALLGSGEIKAATLPEPFSSLAIQQGAQVIVDDTLAPELAYSTYAFRKPVIEASPEAIKAFLAAIEEAINMITADPEKYIDLLVENKLIPEPLAGKYAMPIFTAASVPNQFQWQDVLDWAKSKGLLGKDLPYEESITDEYLP